MSGAGSPRAMAYRTAVTPPQRRRDYVPNSKSSDSLPDLSDILPGRVDARLRTGSRAVALPEGVAAGFQSTSMLLKYNLLKLQQDEDESVRPVKGKKERESNARARPGNQEKLSRKVAKESTKASNNSAGNVVEQKRKSTKRKSDDVEIISALDQFGHHQDEPAQIEATREATTNIAGIEQPIDPASRKRQKMNSGNHADAEENARQTGTSNRLRREKKTAKHSAHFDDLKDTVLVQKDIPNAVTEAIELDGETSKRSQDNLVAPADFANLRNDQPQNDIFEVPSSPPRGPLVDPSVHEGKTGQIRKISTLNSPHFEDQKETALPVVASVDQPAEQVVDLVSSPEAEKRLTETALKSDVPVDGAEVGNKHSAQSPPQQEGTLETPAFKFSELCHNFSYDQANSASFTSVRNVQGATVLRPAGRIDPVPDVQAQPLTIIVEKPGSAVFVAAEMQPKEAEQSPKKKASRKPPKPVLKPKPAKETKKPSPKKGPMTITARSIARYAQVVPEIPGELATVSPHFSAVSNKPQEQVVEDPEQTTTTAVKPRKPRKSKAKDEGETTETKKKKPKKAKNVLIVAPKLVSREQHEAKLKRQDLLFGTSSQLRQDGSPRYVREMQQALQMSVIDEQGPDEGGSSPIPLRTTEAIRRMGRKLWSEGANIDTESGWQDISDVDVQAIPIAAIEDAAQQNALPSVVLDQEPASDSWSFEVSPVASNGFWPNRRPSMSPEPHSAQIPLIATTITISSSPRLSISPPRAVLRALSTNTKSPTKTSTSDGIVARKTKASEGLAKSPRGRPRKDDLSKHSASPAKARGRPRKAPATSPGPQTPKKRGRPPKVRVARDDDDDDGFQHIDDIEDSEPDHTPSPPQKRGSPGDSQTLPLSTTMAMDKAGKRIDAAKLNAQHPNWPAVRAKLFPEITRVVTSAPRTGNIKKPIWHEKMLLYDPIVLEDLTAWLNDKGLRIEGKDGTLVDVSCWMVQSWCEMNSVCCLWKGGLRGGVRVKY